MGRRQQAIDSLKKYLDDDECTAEEAKFIGKVLPKLSRGDITDEMLKHVVMTHIYALLGGLEAVTEQLPEASAQPGFLPQGKWRFSLLDLVWPFGHHSASPAVPPPTPSAQPTEHHR
eukprot:CAMPEP_0202912498 /NCGR_PEP_ID=MMETSP1392-20130828/57915_1 /ASSEMBLY_ACC=CAM_ASM_000868 /TAXON_ID=225041 /ORGANISM="Chlamydomonas chlamydogama, Strain SAG 11-48b" /LENGTH=116 /DNA_ID=CAMNT_0049603423 /DNA_START=354 /DNA_END=701 /DNA_ORIENTATION=+